MLGQATTACDCLIGHLEGCNTVRFFARKVGDHRFAIRSPFAAERPVDTLDAVANARLDVGLMSSAQAAGEHVLNILHEVYSYASLISHENLQVVPGSRVD